MNLGLESQVEYILKCQDCNYILEIPYHCNKQMQITDEALVCWRGAHNPCCNRESVIDIPWHHDKKMVKLNKEMTYI